MASSRTSGRWRKAGELEEERRLAYVGITRARQRLYLTRAVVRSAWGAPQHNPPSRFLAEIPGPPDRLAPARVSRRPAGATPRPPAGARRPGGLGRPGAATPARRPSGPAAVRPRRSRRWRRGTRCCTPRFGLGTVIATSGVGRRSAADVDFGSHGTEAAGRPARPDREAVDQVTLVSAVDVGAHPVAVGVEPVATGAVLVPEGAQVPQEAMTGQGVLDLAGQPRGRTRRGTRS